MPTKMQGYMKKDVIDKIMEINGIPSSYKAILCKRIIKICSPVKYN